MNRQPRLKTIEMVRSTIKRNDSKYSIYQLWKKLPKKMMYQTYKESIEYLKNNNEIIIDGRHRMKYISPNIGLEGITRDQIMYNLFHYGYGFISRKKIRKSKILPLEDIIIEILIRYPEPRFIEAIPTLLIKNKIDDFELYRKSYKYNLINKLGFLLSISFRIAKKLKKNLDYLKGLLKKFESEKQKSIQYFSSIKDKKFLEKTTPECMRSWNLRGRFSFSDFYKETYI
ncbi:MAG: hypothetical protein L6408_03695 [Nanoarchaeota archaeon]|nr:hypothetical protein [Nanoarchaeota archaeon]